MTYKMLSEMRLGATLPEFTQDEVKNEPMFFSASPEFAYEEGGPITRAFFDAFEAEHGGTIGSDKYCFDSRVHMLMPRWWPCIPGWHHDDVPRSRPDGQPNYETPEYRPLHCLALVNGDVAPTEFALGECELPHTSGVVYRDWHPIVDQLCDSGVLTRVSAPDRTLVYFDDRAFHQGTAAVSRGWRWFGRITWNAGYESGRKRHNEIRRQVNVYMENIHEGW